VFEALGEIWVAPADKPSATASVIVPWAADAQYYMPAVSPDGRRLAFVSWNDYSLGQIMTCDLPSCRATPATPAKGIYLYPSWAGDSDKIYALRAQNTNAAAIANFGAETAACELIEISKSGERVVRTSFPLGPLSVGPGGRIYTVQTAGLVDTQVYLQEGKTFPVVTSNMSSVDPAGDSAPRPEFVFPRATAASPSPDGRRVAFVEGWEAYVAPAIKTNAQYAHGEENNWEGPQRPYSIIKENPADGARRVSVGGANTLRWTDPTHVIFALGQTIHIYDVDAGRDRTVTVDAAAPRAVPPASDAVELVGARIITLADAGVIQHGSIVVKGARITCVGTCAHDPAAKVFSLEGKTITAGFTDVHAHGYWPAFPIYSRYYAPAALYLAYGVTTTLDPAADSEGVFPAAELIEAGRITGARSYSTGDVFMFIAPDTGPQSYSDAEAMVRRIAEQGGHSIKVYLTLRRDQREMFAEAARRMGLSVTNEGQDLDFDAGTAMDGDTGFEHMLHYQAIYRDGIQFFAQAKAVYSPTLLVAGAGLWAEEYWQARTDFLHDEKLRRFLPWPELVRRLGAPVRPKADYPFPLHAEAVKDLRRAGGFASLGGHGEQWGLDTHWEMWNYAEAQTPLEVLTMASQGGARMMGLENEIGSIAAGKVADLVILDKNPLDDIHNTTSIAYVMKAGLLFDGTTLDELWPANVPYGTPPWKTTEPYEVSQGNSH
jgi:imidazolonepropionase-like amidohydrolase